MFGSRGLIDAAKINQELLDHSALLIDVRSNEEWDSGHAKNALHLSVERIIHGELPSHDATKKIYVYCRSGVRAAAAASYLTGNGLMAENIGGLGDWEKAGGGLFAGEHEVKQSQHRHGNHNEGNPNKNIR